MGSTNTQIPDLIDERALVELLDCSHRQVQAMRQSGDGPPFIKIGARAVRYAMPDVVKWLESRKRNSTSDPGPQPLDVS